MDILIVITNRNSNPVPVVPMGACLVAEAAERNGHRVKVLDLMFERSPLHALDLILKRMNPDAVGLSIRNIDNNDMQHPVAFFRDLKPLIETIRSNTQAILILGGSAIGVMPEELLRYTGADWAVLGDGEAVFPKLLAALSCGEIPDNVPGIAWLEGNALRKNTAYIPRFSEGCLVPDFHRWINIRTYLSRLSTIPIQAKLGCHFKCVYCTYRKIEGQDYRLCDPSAVVNAIETIAAQGLRDIEFVDNVFNSPYEHALAVCEGIARVRPRARLQSLELNPLFIDDNLLTAMERAGFVGIGITVESASDVVLEGLNKGFTAKEVYNAAQIVRHHKLPCLWIFMLGGPGETQATVRQTLRFAEQHIRPDDTVFFNVGIRIYPGTELEQRAREEGILTIPAEEMLEPVFYLSPFIHRDWLVQEIHHAMSSHMNYINSNSLSLPFLPFINRLGYNLGIKTPLWRHTRSVRRVLKLLQIDA